MRKAPLYQEVMSPNDAAAVLRRRRPGASETQEHEEDEGHERPEAAETTAQPMAMEMIGQEVALRQQFEPYARGDTKPRPGVDSGSVVEAIEDQPTAKSVLARREADEGQAVGLEARG